MQRTLLLCRRSMISHLRLPLATTTAWPFLTRRRTHHRQMLFTCFCSLPPLQQQSFPTTNSLLTSAYPNHTFPSPLPPPLAPAAAAAAAAAAFHRNLSSSLSCLRIWDFIAQVRETAGVGFGFGDGVSMAKGSVLQGREMGCMRFFIGSWSLAPAKNITAESISVQFSTVCKSAALMRNSSSSSSSSSIGRSSTGGGSKCYVGSIGFHHARTAGRRGFLRWNWGSNGIERCSPFEGGGFVEAFLLEGLGTFRQFSANVVLVDQNQRGPRKDWKKRRPPPPQGAGKDSSKTKQAVVVVESPAKAKTIEKYLGSGYTVVASYGHVRDLAARAGSVRPDDDYTMLWEVPATARPHINSIKAAVKGAEMLVLASDPDREGEAIAWHVLEMLTMEGALKKGMKVKRVVFNEITKAAVLRAMEAPREISGTLVNAYLARRALDYLIGFDLSPVLWRKLPGSKSAGRVQSAALRLVCERELAIEAFHSREYWTVEAQLTKDANNSVSRGGFRARLTHYLGEKLGQFALGNSIEAEAASKSVGEAKLRVGSVKKSLLRRTPPAPYITSTLQQDASTKLAFGASRTMAIAQQLYEGVKLDNEEQTGLITYMRTDGVQISNEAVESIRQLAAARYGEEYVPSQKRQFTSRVKNAQEAHEAIRPTDINCLPSSLATVLEEDALKLYTLIWARTMACQLEQAILSQVAIDIVDDTDNVQLRSNGSSVSFPGYLAVLEDMAALGVKLGDPQEQEKEEEEGGALENFEVGDLVTLSESCAIQHFTEPPPRFSEGTIVKRLEELGIGRPSTYASTLRTLQLRNYVRLEKRRIFPETRGRMVSAFLSHYFPQFSDYDFTANMENQLDEVSAGHANWKALLAKFWPEFHENVLAAMKIPIDKVVEMLEEIFAKQFFPPASSGGEDRVCPSCKEGRVCMKLSRFGSGYFFGCTRYPTCLFKANVMSSGDNDSSDDDEDSEAPKQWSLIARPPKVLGVDPATQLQVVVRVGPYGGYVQLGEASKKQKPRRTTLPKGVKAEDISLEKALELLSYPRELGKHPEEGTPITIGIGKFGFYVRHRAIIASVPQEIFVQELTLEKALKLLKGRNVSKRGRPPYKAVAEVATTDKVTSLPDSESVSHTEEQNQSTEQLAGNKNKKGKEKKKQLHKSQNGAAVTSPSNGPPVIADPSASSQLAEDDGGTTSRMHLDLPKKGRGRPRKSQEASNNSQFLATNAMTQQPLP